MYMMIPVLVSGLVLISVVALWNQRHHRRQHHR